MHWRIAINGIQLCFALLFAIVCTLGARGDVKTFNVGVGNFHVANNWSPTGIPGPEDRIIIPSDSTCFVTDGHYTVIDSMHVEEDARLVIQKGSDLALENDDDNLGTGAPNHSIVDGSVEQYVFESNGSDLIFPVSHVISGIGMMASDSTTNYIWIAGGHIVKNQLAEADKGLRGSLTISRIPDTTFAPWEGRFKNEGIVAADDTLASGDFIERGWSATWTFNQHVMTCGGFVRYTGGIALASGATFSYQAFTSAPSGCSNPGSVTGTPSCSNRYTVSASVSNCQPCGGGG